MARPTNYYRSTVDRSFKIHEIQNNTGQKLACAVSTHNKQHRSALYNAFQDIFMILNIGAIFWCLAAAICLLFIPYVRYLWILWNIYSLLFGRHETDATFPFYHRILRPTSLFRHYRNFYADYFPIKLYRSALLPASRKYVFGYHPHGISIIGMTACFGLQTSGFETLFPGLRPTVLVTSFAFRIPLWRSYIQLLGGKSVSRESCIRQLAGCDHRDQRGANDIVISVGGSREADCAEPNTMKVLARTRKGFVRVAIEAGADIVPVIAFGENDIWDRPEPGTSIGARMLRHLIRRPADVRLVSGRVGFLLPHRKPISVVVGTPITVEQQATPDPDYVDSLQNLYLEQLKAIWETWREHFGMPESVAFEFID